MGTNLIKFENLQAWKEQYTSWVEKRLLVASCHLDNEIKSMFEDAWQTKGGRWDVEGLKLELAGLLGNGEQMDA